MNAIKLLAYKLLPGLSQPVNSSEPGKMSKSDSNSGIFVHNTDDEVRAKIKKAWCEQGNIENNPILEIAKHVVYHEFGDITIERPEKFGGNVNYNNYQELEKDFSQNKLSPADLKPAIAEYLVKIIAPIRDKLSLGPDLLDTIQKSA